MASIVPGFEYDIFISYRQKDNKGEHWVTEFVKALNAELEAAFKESIAVYFDSNPTDGLSATHDVDDSLKEKLKCAVFIPIISQTYCDPKSFAWKDEFLAFKQLATSDEFGLKIKLQNGNVASRILPVRIHNLDDSDKQLLESELGPLRSVDFVYNSGSAARPLLHNELEPKANLDRTYYRDQLASLVKAIKELLGAMQSPASFKAIISDQSIAVKPSAKRKISLIAATVLILGLTGFLLYNYFGWGKNFFQERDRSIAVLPFENMNRDSTQDYFSNGMSEDILNHLVKIADLRVKSRTSTLQYKGTTKTASQIGDELNVANIVEGSVRRVGDQVRIVVQLIDAQKDEHLWSETYDRDFKDVLSLQSEIAMEIAKALQAQLSDSEKEDLSKKSSQNITAYDYYMKAREAVQHRVELKRPDYENAFTLINQSLKLEPDFSKGLSFKATLWFSAMNQLGISDKIAIDSARYYANKSIEADQKAPDGYLLLSSLNSFLGKIDEANRYNEIAYKLAPNDPGASFNYGYMLLEKHDEHGADLILKSIENDLQRQDAGYYTSYVPFYTYSDDYETAEKLYRQAQKLDPANFFISTDLVNLVYWRQERFDKAIDELKKIKSNHQWLVDQLAYSYYFNGDYVEAAKQWAKYKEIETEFEDSTQTVPFRHRLGMAYQKLGQKKKADSLIKTQLRISSEMISGARSTGVWSARGSHYYDVAVCHALLGEYKEAIQYLDSGKLFGFLPINLAMRDPALQALKNRGDFKALTKDLIADEEFRKFAFTNALNRAQASKEFKGLIDR